MSTVPGRDSWRDAGLAQADLAEPFGAGEPLNLAEEAEAARETPSADPGEDYRPGTARPDREGTAAEADVAEQSAAVPAGDDEPGEDDF